MNRKSSNVTDVELGIALENNLIEQIKFYATSSIVKYYDNVNMTRFVTGFPVSTLNLIAGAKLKSNKIDQEIERALNPFKKEQGFPMIWWVGPNTEPHNIGNYLEKKGFKRIFDMSGMYFDLENLGRMLILPPNFRFELVESEQDLRIWAETQTRAYEGDLANIEFIYKFEKSLGLGPNLPWKRFVGYMKENPVAVSILFEGTEVAGIFNVATIPKIRRTGIGTIMTNMLLFKARELGYEISVLKATPMGEKLYQSLGFIECCKIRAFFLKSYNDQFH
ncbi:MAG: GNAT family N-acetyltransferase [Candidatus Hodarchaeota archaeon]